MISPGNPMLFSRLVSSCHFCLRHNLTNEMREAATKFPNNAYEANGRFW